MLARIGEELLLADPLHLAEQDHLLLKLFQAFLDGIAVEHRTSLP